MNRTENDLRAVLRELEQRADRHGAPSSADLLAATLENRLGESRQPAPRRLRRWLPPFAAAVAVAAAATTAVLISPQSSSPSNTLAPQPGGQPTAGHTRAHRPPVVPHHSAPSSPAPPSAADILDDAAATLDAAPGWAPPAPQDFFYVRTNEVTTWTSVSGTQPGRGRTAGGQTVPVPGCDHGQIVAIGESGSCTLKNVPHYLDDAPTSPAKWDAYLEQLAPGAKAANAQGKIIVEVLHQYLVAPKAAAALLRYTASCPGLHTLTVRPVGGAKLIGVTCTSMTHGSYGLVFDAASHDFLGFVGVTGSGRQNGPAEIVRQTGIVPAIGRTP